MNLDTEFTTADFVILKVFKKMKKKKKKLQGFLKRKFFSFGKILPTQTSNLAICLDIYVGICRMLTGIARVTTGSVCRLLY